MTDIHETPETHVVVAKETLRQLRIAVQGVMAGRNQFGWQKRDLLRVEEALAELTGDMPPGPRVEKPEPIDKKSMIKAYIREAQHVLHRMDVVDYDSYQIERLRYLIDSAMRAIEKQEAPIKGPYFKMPDVDDHARAMSQVILELRKEVKVLQNKVASLEKWRSS